MGLRLDNVGVTTQGVVAAKAALVAVAFYVAAAVSLSFRIDDGSVVPIWLASGVALAGILAWGRWMAVGAFVGNVLASVVLADLSWLLAVGISLGDTLSVVAAAIIVLAIGETLAFSHARCVLGLAVASPVTAAIAATVGIALLSVGGVLALDADRAWVRYWLSGITGMLLVTPLLLSWLRGSWEVASRWRVAEALALAAALIVLSSLMVTRSTWNFIELLFVLPLFSWAITRFGTRGATGASALFALVLGYAVLDRNILIAGTSLADTIDVMQVLVSMLAVANLVIAAALTERREAIDELRVLLDTFNHSQRIAHVGSWELRLNDSGRVWCSDELRRMLPIRTDAASTVSLDDILATADGLDRQRLARALERAIHSGRSFQLEHRVRGTDRVLHHVAGIVRDHDDGAAVRVVGSVVDITRARAMERFQDELIATASHELRTPLTSIVGFAETLLDGWHDLPESRRIQFVGIIAAQSHRLERIVEDTLLQSRVEAGAVHPNVHTFLVGRSVRRALENLEMDDVELRIPSGLLAWGDAEQFVQVIENLLTNAHKYGSPPYAIVGRERGDQLVEVRVEDHGVGMPPSFGAKAFDRFARGPDVGTAPGTGLGLSITRGLLDAVGGSIHHERWDGVTSFVVRVPAGRTRTPLDDDAPDVLDILRDAAGPSEPPS